MTKGRCRRGWRTMPGHRGQSYYGGLYFDLYGLPALKSMALPDDQAFGPALKLNAPDLVGGEPAGDSTTVRCRGSIGRDD